jgi:predicted aconitase
MPRRVATNSAKAAKYLRDLRGLDVMILSLEEIAERFFIS